MKVKRVAIYDLLIVIFAIWLTSVICHAATDIKTNVASANPMKSASQEEEETPNITPEPKETANTETDDDSNPTPTQPQLPTSDNIKVMSYFIEKGLSPAAAAGIVANLAAESSLNPAALEGGRIASESYMPQPGVGFGIAQWTNDERQAGLIQLARQKSLPATDISVQLEYIWQELNTDFLDTLERLKAIDGNLNGVSELTQATVIFHGATSTIMNHPVVAAVKPSRGYESSGDSAQRIINWRCRLAEDIYSQYMDCMSSQ